MSEAPAAHNPAKRPTKAQHALLDYIQAFIKQHGYGPSYREIMRALEYSSVSTVAVHVDGLVAAGRLRKKGRSARSLEVVGKGEPTVALVLTEDEAWLVKRLEEYLADIKASDATLQSMLETFTALELPLAKAAVERHIDTLS
ncbi:hypothetical protein JNJ66_07170 [Candidatus Saccharibacteria bacterium]|nr:hypothetical protein [Candidatus Saccharibacteria bacterium]